MSAYRLIFSSCTSPTAFSVCALSGTFKNSMPPSRLTTSAFGNMIVGLGLNLDLVQARFRVRVRSRNFGTIAKESWLSAYLTVVLDSVPY